MGKREGKEAEKNKRERTREDKKAGEERQFALSFPYVISHSMWALEQLLLMGFFKD